jgi:ribosomal protein S11
MLKINKNKLKEIKFIILIKKRLMDLKPNKKQCKKRKIFNDLNMDLIKIGKRWKKRYIIYNWISFNYKRFFVKNNLKRIYKLKNFFNSQKKKIKFVKLDLPNFNEKSNKFFNKLKPYQKKKFIKKIIFRRNLVYKISCISFLYNFKKVLCMHKIISKRNIKKNTKIFLAKFKIKIVDQKKITKFLNFKFRVKKRKKNLNKKNLFMKKNVKRQKRIKPHYLVLRTSEANCHMNLTDSKGNTKFVVSCGHLGFKGSKRSSKYAIEKLTILVIKKLKKYRLLNIIAKLKGYSKKHKTNFKLFFLNKIR